MSLVIRHDAKSLVVEAVANGFIIYPPDDGDKVVVEKDDAGSLGHAVASALGIGTNRIVPLLRKLPK